MTAEERAIKFLEGLTELTKKYKVAIGGCGCCYSPYLDNIDENTYYTDKITKEYWEVKWSEEKQKYQTLKDDENYGKGWKELKKELFGNEKTN